MFDVHYHHHSNLELSHIYYRLSICRYRICRCASTTKKFKKKKKKKNFENFAVNVQWIVFSHQGQKDLYSVFLRIFKIFLASWIYQNFFDASKIIFFVQFGMSIFFRILRNKMDLKFTHTYCKYAL